ncbi:MAG: lactate utilization protein [Deltaproteobacteria bacterium]|nr:lactate utilization protein [Deltaproteobacteria bacterium]
MQTKVNYIAEFVDNAEKVSAVVSKKRTMNEAVLYCIELCNQNNQKSIAVPNILLAKLFKTKHKVLSDDIYDERANIDIGFTLCDHGIANTGTLVLNSSNEKTRIATMLCDIHVAVVKESTVVQNAKALSETLKDGMNENSDYTAFITGASRTADIERTLAIGVHGPLELHIIVLEGS